MVCEFVSFLKALFFFIVIVHPMMKNETATIGYYNGTMQKCYKKRQ